MKVAVVVRIDGGFLAFSREIEVTEADVAAGKISADDAYDAVKWAGVLKQIPKVDGGAE